MAKAFAPLLALVLIPSVSWGCACGCGIFDVGTFSMFPEGPGGMIYENFDYQDQTHNYAGSSRAPSANNDDKELRTYFVTTGIQYFFNRSIGVQLEVPFVNRTFTTVGESGEDIVGIHWNAIGDIRLKGVYTGFSPDMSTGVTFGVKLPTGDWKHSSPLGDVDRDTEIGTGSTDLLLGIFHHGNLTSDHQWRWFAQAELDAPLATQDGYRPGVEIDGAAGIYYDGWSVGSAKIRPVAQVLVAERTRDTGPNSANPVASGYQRVLLSPGIEVEMHPITVHADVEFTTYEHVTGNQIVAPELFKLTFEYHF